MTERVSRPRVKPAALLPSQALQTPERTPLASMLQAGFSEHSVPLLWHRVQAGLHQRKRPLIRTPFALAFAGMAVALIALWGFWGYRNSHGALRLSSGQLPAALIAEATTRNVELSDGSRIQVAQQSRLEVVSNDGTTFVTALSRGSAHFEVNPKGKRRWIIEAGLTSVEVVGTRFTVTRDEHQVKVSVEKGLVLVRGASVPGGRQRLGAGQHLVAPTTLEPPAKASPRPARAIAQAETSGEAPSDAVESDAVESDANDTAKNAVPGGFRIIDADEPDDKVREGKSSATPGAKAYLKAPNATQARQMPPDIESLLSEADRAREAGDLARSLRYFEQVIAQAPRFDPRRGLAAMSVARMTMGTNPARAAQALKSTLDGMPAALQENATARLVEAYSKSGQVAEARRMAKHYLDRFPSGRRADDVRRWANP